MIFGVQWDHNSPHFTWKQSKITYKASNLSVWMGVYAINESQFTLSMAYVI